MKQTRIQKHYSNIVVEDIILMYNCQTFMQLPKLNKGVVNISSKSSLLDKQQLIRNFATCLLISGQRGAPTRAQKSISAFQLRKGNVMGCMVTMRKNNMYTLLDKIVSFVLPRLQDQANKEARSAKLNSVAAQKHSKAMLATVTRKQSHEYDAGEHTLKGSKSVNTGLPSKGGRVNAGIAPFLGGGVARLQSPSDWLCEEEQRDISFGIKEAAAFSEIEGLFGKHSIAVLRKPSKAVLERTQVVQSQAEQEALQEVSSQLEKEKRVQVQTLPFYLKDLRTEAANTVTHTKFGFAAKNVLKLLAGGESAKFGEQSFALLAKRFVNTEKGRTKRSFISVTPSLSACYKTPCNKRKALFMQQSTRFFVAPAYKQTLNTLQGLNVLFSFCTHKLRLKKRRSISKCVVGVQDLTNRSAFPQRKRHTGYRQLGSTAAQNKQAVQSQAERTPSVMQSQAETPKVLHARTHDLFFFAKRKRASKVAIEKQKDLLFLSAFQHPIRC